MLLLPREVAVLPGDSITVVSKVSLLTDKPHYAFLVTVRRQGQEDEVMHVTLPYSALRAEFVPHANESPGTRPSKAR
jgi:hypothetical protein